LDQQHPGIDDVEDTWNQFAAQFTAAFTDTQRDQRARNQLETLKMKWPDIDQYTMDFEKLVQEAGYRIGTPESIQMYIKGLPYSVAKDVLAPPLVHTYQEVLGRAVESIKSQELLNTLSKMRGTPAKNPFRQGGWQNFGRNQTQRPSNTSRPTEGGQFNSSNAPRAFNNAPIPMDLSRTQGNRGQGRGHFRNNAALTQPLTRGNCYNCSQPGHYAKNCPQKKKT